MNAVGKGPVQHRKAVASDGNGSIQVAVAGISGGLSKGILAIVIDAVPFVGPDGVGAAGTGE